MGNFDPYDKGIKQNVKSASSGRMSCEGASAVICFHAMEREILQKNDRKKNW